MALTAFLAVYLTWLFYRTRNGTAVVARERSPRPASALGDERTNAAVRSELRDIRARLERTQGNIQSALEVVSGLRNELARLSDAPLSPGDTPEHGAAPSKPRESPSVR